MIHLRTTLLFLAFILFLVQNLFPSSSNLAIFLVLRFAPSLIILLWIVISLVFKQTYILRESAPSFVKRIFKLSKALAFILLITAAMTRLFSAAEFGFLITSSIGLMTLYSFIIGIYSRPMHEEDPDILDDQTREMH